MTATQFDIAGRAVGEGCPVFVIAELSANHGHSLDVAKKTIDAAAEAGADAIKLQTYTPDTLTLDIDKPPFVVKTKNEWAGRTLYDLYREAMTPWEWHAELKAHAEARGLVLFSTPFDATAVAFLDELGVPAWKVASFELNDLPLVEAMAATGKPIIVSTGMASLADIEAAVRVCRAAGNERIVLLRCVSSYPARAEDMALRSLETLRGFGTVLGLSDHTRTPTAAVAAVALGARVLEKHFILDRSVGGPDAFFSLEPAELRATVEAVRAAEAALGVPRFGPSPDELASTAFRRSLYVTRDVAAGEVVTAESVRSIRPAGGMAPSMLPEVLGRPATRALVRGEPARPEMFGARPTPRVTLRRATRDDAERLLAWRNDELTRRMSVNEAPVTRAEHEAWLERSLASADRALLVAESGEAVGTVRLDRTAAHTWELSLTVAPTARGRGLGVDLLGAAEKAATELGATRLVARIHRDNEASRRTFLRAGWYGLVTRNDEAGRPWLRLERRIAAWGT